MMQRIDPVTEASCRPHCGKPVLIYLHDGTEVYGVLSRVDKDRLHLGDTPFDTAGTAARKGRGKARVSSRGKKPKSRVKALEPSGEPESGAPRFGWSSGSGYGGALTLELASVGALFLLA
ncbi:hypothetical protein B5M42_013870 [Paenibacillus athensensis]|uniref:Uncharacterized protein n=1 Tax=Paenibacillus athensensis TaxID=1967502 RepID=A0A4Y8PZY8_9BACL|nr:hypothetical protein [Paenibacillus athensensis]MCD1259919.1 hypothetical protein [Paenibacillus athensensis]